MRGVMLACFLPGLAMAQSYDGVYRPAGDWAMGWDCRSVGMDGGAVAILDGRFMGVENTCDLTNPATVEGLSATLYDMQCMAEGESYSERVMLMAAPGGLYVIRNEFVAEWVRCP